MPGLQGTPPRTLAEAGSAEENRLCSVLMDRSTWTFEFAMTLRKLRPHLSLAYAESVAETIFDGGWGIPDVAARAYVLDIVGGAVPSKPARTLPPLGPSTRG